jgi:precorrin-6B methylase 1
MSGSLTVVGPGLDRRRHLTPETVEAIKSANKVLYATIDPNEDAAWVRMINPAAESFNDLFSGSRHRNQNYELMVERILSEVRAGFRVCMVAYGHPGVLDWACHESIRRAQAAGFPAHMLPGISSEACLIADLGMDPGDLGWQSCVAERFLRQPRAIDPRVPLILWQVGVVGHLTAPSERTPFVRGGIRLLAETLAKIYGAEHGVMIYEFRTEGAPIIQHVTVATLEDSYLTPLSTLVVPAKGVVPEDAEMAARLAAVGRDDDRDRVEAAARASADELQRSDALRFMAGGGGAVVVSQVGGNGAEELTLLFATKEVTFDEASLFPFARALATRRRFVAEEALAWGSPEAPYTWDVVRDVLRELLAHDILELEK